MEYDFSNPDGEEGDLLVYAAGHKAMGLYAMWALRNELVRIGRGNLLPGEESQLRLEDLLGFRRNPTNDTPLFRKYNSKPLDGHPTPATPFLRVATGASGVGVPAALGLALGAVDLFGRNCPKVHMLEGEGGMTPGRVHEALAAASAAQLYNSVLHIDWNQSSIDSDHVCREGDLPGDYVQWDPAEICYCHDWNVVMVQDGTDFQQIVAAQKLAPSIENDQPSAIVYRTTKGWRYGIEGKGSHGAGHKFCSEGYYEACKEFETGFGVQIPRFNGEKTPSEVEELFFETLMAVRKALEKRNEIPQFGASRILESQKNLELRGRQKKETPSLAALYAAGQGIEAEITPSELALTPGDSATLRGALGDVLNYLNRRTEGAFIGTSADLSGSTSISNVNKGFDPGMLNAVSNPGSRLIPVGGICEDAMGALMAGLSSFGHHIGVTSSYGAFIGALEHVAARLHGIGQQSRLEVNKGAYNTWIMINAHAGIKTGEDGPTHADPQVLQLLQENFPKGVLITLTPWDVQEMWPLVVTALKARPAVLCPFVTRPPDEILDREALGLPPAHAAAKGVYAFRKADESAPLSGTLVLQGNAVATVFINEVLPVLDQKGLNLNVFYVASAELFDLLSPEERESIFPEALRHQSMGITDFTLATMYRWVRSNDGLRRTLHSFRDGHYLGSGKAEMVIREAGLHAEGQIKAVLEYVRAKENQPPIGALKQKPATDLGKEQVLANLKKIRLTCGGCGSLVDPKDLFGGEAPDDEFCVDCEYRDPEVCPYCRASWLISLADRDIRCPDCGVTA
jgi:transketolase